MPFCCSIRGVLENTNIIAEDTARLAVGDINPPGIAQPSEAAGAGTRALLLHPPTPAGTVGGGGPAGTLFWIDQKRRGAIVFMAQVMSPFQGRLFAAIEQDLNCQLPESSARTATAATM